MSDNRTIDDRRREGEGNKTCEKDCPFYVGPGECSDGVTTLFGPGQQFGCLLWQMHFGESKTHLDDDEEDTVRAMTRERERYG